ncbi:A disintegrin and metalloproteinase with thrombospondin motifs 1 [Lates japonicus]|uniref:A disintegrin and metalloproteinase with thrombospondin motifs 1 n=1 Tax=Lates japonicus TaxID=270547 RepID=A0AAD3NIF6_LATJO|nr:A disintegrin and metalloproteinase with thrombospondin motifs 1 [Lates japonicus]
MLVADQSMAEFPPCGLKPCLPQNPILGCGPPLYRHPSIHNSISLAWRWPTWYATLGTMTPLYSSPELLCSGSIGALGSHMMASPPAGPAALVPCSRSGHHISRTTARGQCLLDNPVKPQPPQPCRAVYSRPSVPADAGGDSQHCRTYKHHVAAVIAL